MPRTRSLAWAELKIGVLSVSAALIAAVVIFMVGGESGFFWQQYHLKTRFHDVRGLKAGAVVRVAGVEVGQVASVQFVGAEVEVAMKIHQSMQDKITSASRASIGSLSLLGESALDITPSTLGERLKDWDYVPAAESGAQIADVAESASRSLEEATKLFRDVRGGRGTVGKLFTDEALYREITSFVDAAGKVANGLKTGQGTLGQLVVNPGIYSELERGLRELDEVLGRINAGEGSLGRLVNDDTLAKSLASASARIDDLAGKAQRGEGTVGKLLTDDQLYGRLTSVTQRLDQLTEQLNAGQGTAGQLLHDKQLYENMNAAVAELRSLVGDIRKDPRKYLQVKVSIF